jgi:pimeloyl-ACP methyl ester carboxylesterase
MGSVTAWLEAARYHDVDAFVLTGLLHRLKPTLFATALASTYPAPLDPKFADAGLDPGYITTMPGTRSTLFYYAPNVDQTVLDEDERLKDTYSESELAEVETLLNAAPLLSPSRSITVPTLLAVGDHDNIMCGPPDGLDCTQAALESYEASYYQSAAELEIFIAPDSGHDLQLQRNGAASNAAIIDWVNGLD